MQLFRCIRRLHFAL